MAASGLNDIVESGVAVNAEASTAKSVAFATENHDETDWPEAIETC